VRALKWLGLLLICLLLAIGAVIFFVPFIWMVFGVFKNSGELTTLHPTLFPRVWTTQNFTRLFKTAPYGAYYLNSLITTAWATAGSLLTSAIAGYVFAKKQFWGRELVFMAILSTMMVPFSATMIPLYLLVASIGLMNTLAAVVLPSVVHPFGIYLMRRHVETIPDELIEAAFMDGAPEPWVFTQVIVPLSTASLAALSIFMFMFNWNNFLWPLIVLSDAVKMTLSVGIAAFQMDAWTSYDLSVTAGALAIVPVLIVFAFAQRYIVEGLTLTGMKS
jgi:multiple sugar transport system permease protein